MYTIVMNDKKELITTKYATLYQKEKLADQIQFIYPQTCGLVDLSECIAVLKYIDIGNEAHSEILSKDSEPYKETKVRAVLPVDTELNRFAGNVSVRLVFMKMNPESMQLEQKMMSGNVIITIEPVDAITESTEADSALQKEDITTGSANGTIAVDGTDVEVKGLGSAAYADTTAFDAAGVAEEKVNTLANGAVADNTAAIAAINNVETGILKQAKDYVDTAVDELAAKSVMLVTATKTDDVWSTDKTFAEIQAHIQGGGTAVLCEDDKYLNFTTSSETNVIFSCIDIINETYVMSLGLGGSNSPNLMETTFDISSDNTIAYTNKLLSVADVEARSLVTEDKTVTGAINEVNAKALTQSDWSVNDESDVAFIKNRPFYHYIEEQKEVTLTFDGNLENYEYVEIETSSPLASDPLQFEDVSYAIKMTDVIPMDTSCFVGSTAVTFSNNEESSVIITEDDISDASDGIVSVGNGFLVVLDDNCEFIGAVFSKGIYFLYTGQISVASGILSPITYAKQITYTGNHELLKKIDNRFQHQSNWNENDSASAAFIKNKPFYEETSLQRFDLTDNFTFESQTSDGITAQNGQATLSLPFGFTVGETYKFTINGFEYEFICQDMTDFLGEGAIGFGDIDAMLNGDMTLFNFIAFGMYNTDSPNEFAMSTIIKTESEITEFAIDAVVTNLVKIDEKYLPDIVFDKINTAQTTADNAQTTADNAQTTADNAIGKAETNASNLSTEITNREAADNLKMDKENPVGTGSFSMNRAADSIIGDYSRSNGYNTAAQGVYSSTDGLGTIASARSVCVSGEYNVEDISYSATKFTISPSTYGFEKQSTFYYSSEYNFDEKTGIYVLVSPSTVLDSELANNIKNYVDKIFIVDNSKRMLIPNAISGQSAIKIRSGAGSIYNATTYYSFRGASVSYAEPSTDVRGKYAHIIGNGTAEDVRSNAHTLDWNGNAWYQGSVEATAMILLSPNGTRFSITVGDDGVLKSDEIVE